jgi:hypothetical protein
MKDMGGGVTAITLTADCDGVIDVEVTVEVVEGDRGRDIVDITGVVGEVESGPLLRRGVGAEGSGLMRDIVVV